MQRLKTVLCIVTTSLGLLSLSAQADDWHNRPRGFNTYLSSVVEIQKQGRDDDPVVLQGRLTNYLGKNNYEFTDLKGDSIEVELDDDLDWSKVHRDQLITIKGKVEKNMFTMQVEAKHYSILTDLNSVTGSTTSRAQVVTTVRKVTATTTTAPQVARGGVRPEQSPALVPVANASSAAYSPLPQDAVVASRPMLPSQGTYTATISTFAQPVPQAMGLDQESASSAQQPTPAIVVASQAVAASHAPRSNAVLSLEEFVEQAKNEVKSQENTKQTLAQQELQERDMRRGYINLAPQSSEVARQAEPLASDTTLDPLFKAAYTKLSQAVLSSEPNVSNHAKYSSFVTSNTEHLPSHEAAQALVSSGNRIGTSQGVVNSLRKNEQAPAFNYTAERESNYPQQLTPTIKHGAENSNLPMVIDSTVSEIQSKIKTYQQD